MTPPVRGIVLAGGRSTRMGRDKALLPVAGVPLIRRICDRLLPLCEEVLVVVGSLRHNPYAQLLDGRVRFAEDRFPGCGPLAGLHAGLLAAGSGYGFLFACDMPIFSPALFTSMLAHAVGYEAVLCRNQPFHALYRADTAAKAEQRLQRGDYKLQHFADSLRCRYLEAPDDTCFLNLNYPEEYARFVGFNLWK